MKTKADELMQEEVKQDLRYLKLLSKKFPTVAEACTEIINLEAILELPKGTEHFLTDIHGEYEAFQHVLKNASGSVARKVNEIFGQTMFESEKKELCTLIYYPEEKLDLVRAVEPTSTIGIALHCTSSSEWHAPYRRSTPAQRCRRLCLPSLLIYCRSCCTNHSQSPSKTM